MKKIFTLLTMVFMAIGVNAQTISWSTTIAKGKVAGTYSSGSFLLTSTDTDNKQEVDANPAFFGTADEQVKFEYRLKTGGKSTPKNSLSLTIPNDGTLKVYVRTGSNSATDRNVVLTQSGTELYNAVVKEADAVKVKGLDEKDPEKDVNVYPIISVSVKAGTVAITYPINGLNFYGFEFISGGGEDPQPVDVAFSLTKEKIFTDETSQIIISGKSGLDGLTMNDLTYDNSVINIDESGKITPVAAGTSTITFTTNAVDKKYNEGSANLSITVEERPIPEEIDFPTSTNGIICNGSAACETVKVQGNNIPGYKFSGSGREQGLVLLIQDGFKEGDVVTIAGVLYSGNTTKSAKLQLYQTEDGAPVWDTGDLNEVKEKSDAEPTEGSYTLEAASDKLYIARISGSTGSAASCFATKIKVVRGSGTQNVTVLPVSIENNGATYNLGGQHVNDSYHGVVIKNGKKIVKK